MGPGYAEMVRAVDDLRRAEAETRRLSALLRSCARCGTPESAVPVTPEDDAPVCSGCAADVERELCAEACDAVAATYVACGLAPYPARDCAAKIRARGAVRP